MVHSLTRPPYSGRVIDRHAYPAREPDKPEPYPRRYSLVIDGAEGPREVPVLEPVFDAHPIGSQFP